MDLILGSFLAFERKHTFPLTQKWSSVAAMLSSHITGITDPLFLLPWRRGLIIMYQGHFIPPIELWCFQQMPTVVAGTVTGTD